MNAGVEDVGDAPALALVGRVPVKVTDEGGSIRVGDLLVSSSTPPRDEGAEPSCPRTIVRQALQPPREWLGYRRNAGDAPLTCSLTLHDKRPGLPGLLHFRHTASAPNICQNGSGGEPRHSGLLFQHNDHVDPRRVTAAFELRCEEGIDNVERQPFTNDSGAEREHVGYVVVLTDHAC